MFSNVKGYVENSLFPCMSRMNGPLSLGGEVFYLPMIIMVLEPCVWLETISHTTDHLFGFSFS